MVRPLYLAVLSVSLLGGCSGFQSYSGSGQEIMDSQQTTVAAGDERLKRAIEENSVSATTELDDAIDPALQGTAERARERLDNDLAGYDDTLTDNSLWHRLRSGFAMSHEEDRARVQQHLDWYRQHPNYINRVVDRGHRYLHHIVSEAEARGLPLELALLPVVESAFDPFAYSHGRAAGLWQFIPSTGQHFGLDQSWWHDDRRDVLAATDAALTYLEQLADRFDGDYTLALAAYNSGGGTVSRAIRRNTQSGKPTDYWSLSLPRETRSYVPKLLALAIIFDRPEEFGITLPPLNDEPYFKVVETGGQIDLAQAASLAGVDVDEIYLLNPSFNRWATRPEGPHRLLVPYDSAEKFVSGLARIDPETRVAWQDYKVVAGDNLGAIARRFDTTASVLKQVNGLSGDMIRAGQQLLIPVARSGEATYALSQTQRLEQTRNRAGQNTSGTRIEHRVRQGDTFWELSRRHNVSVRQIAAWNNMAPGDPLIPGKQLVIWSGSAQAGSTPASNSRNNMVRRVGYQVRQGDSLHAIASRFSVAVSDIASWNDLNTARYLQPGQSLVLYVDVRNSP